MSAVLDDFARSAFDGSWDWARLDAELPWLAAMHGVPQDPVHHAEGDVRIHTEMVCRAMAASPAWRARDPIARERTMLAALLHDVAKPRCTVVQDDGRVRSPGHSPAGAIMAREILWRAGLPASHREPICGLVRHHQVPYHAIDRDDARAVVIRLSQSTHADDLALVCEADVRGRVCADQARLVDNVELFREFCRDLGCLDRAFAFASDHARAMYFHRHDRDPTHAAFDDTRMTVTLMSGLPGAGKSHWVATHAGQLPCISLDAIRDELDVDPSETQAVVVAQARERARIWLRAGQDFVWDATNLGRPLRRGLIELFYAYGARVRIVHVEAPDAVLRARNRRRTRPVPDPVIDRLLRRWEIPQPSEAHEVLWVE